ncbi:MFS transporter [Streptomyces sp. NBC_01190]|uniref:MFS transporter n=1 Tax=Streptomyces sp. NBC_01190 TaxID=2903767 RepID=UPI00386489B8|nr:MFS transporter [Streptomyces sp. NBC_01190]
MAATWLAGVQAAIGLGAVSPVSSAVQSSFGLSFSTVACATSFITAVGAVFGIPAGWWTSRFGAGRALPAGLVVIAVTAGLSGLADSWLPLLALRTVEGAGYLLVFVAGPIVLTGMTSGRGRAAALALWGTCVPTGLAVAAAAGGAFGAALTWHGWLAVTAIGPLLLAAYFLAATPPPTPPGSASAPGPADEPTARPRPDSPPVAGAIAAAVRWPGSERGVRPRSAGEPVPGSRPAAGLRAAARRLRVAGTVRPRSEARPRPGSRSGPAGATGAAEAARVGSRRRRAGRGDERWGEAVGRFCVLAGAYALLSLIGVAVVVILPRFLVEVRHQSAAAAGAVVAVVAAASAVGGLLASRLLRRGVPVKALVPLAALMPLGCVPAFSAAVPSAAGLGGAVVVLLVDGLLISAVFAAVPAVARGPADVNLANGALVQFGSLGILTGPPVFGLVVGYTGWSGTAAATLCCTALASGLLLVTAHRVSAAAPDRPAAAPGRCGPDPGAPAETLGRRSE